MGIFLKSNILLTIFIFLYKYNFFLLDFYFYIFNSGLKLILGFSGITLLFIFFPAIGQRYSSNKQQLILIMLFILLVYLFITTNNFLIFFLCYELFLLPSFLIVFFGSPNRRGVIASIYFLMWTQIGSFLVFCGILLLFLEKNTFLFNSFINNPIIIFLIFFGFGIKIPIWPFHYWLTKTHVEAPTYFSIYLSGFLVKTALYGLWVFLYNINNCYFLNFFFIISVFGIIDSSIKMWSQVDLKKLVAYGTIQEMNLILITFLIGTSNSIKSGSLFIIAHTLLSTIFFLLSDTIYRRFNTRTTYNTYGLLNNQSVLGYIIFICCIFFSGLPFTLKFIVEVYVYTQLFNTNFTLMFIIILICNWIGLVSFNKHWFYTLFGTPKNTILIDVSLRELYIYLILLVLLFLISFFSFFII